MKTRTGLGSSKINASVPDDDLDLVKHRAESIALNSLPLDQATPG
jgi:hypothetical protein